MLFAKALDGWRSWADVFCDTAAFFPLIQAIFAENGLGEPEPLQKLTPGTNAVFRAGQYVVKVFAPEESGFNSLRDFLVESAMLAFAKEQGVRAPFPIAIGKIQDRYLFRYIVMGHIEGVEAYDALPSLSPDKQRSFIKSVLLMLGKLHQPKAELLPALDIKARALQNPRLERLPGQLANQMRARAESLCWRENVVVHGDMTGENVLIAPDGSPVLIDFADACYGPAFYEEAALVFGLLRGERALVRTYTKDAPEDAFLDTLLDSLSLHDFGPNIIEGFARQQNMPMPDTIEALRSMMINTWWGEYI